MKFNPYYIAAAIALVLIAFFIGRWTSSNEPIVHDHSADETSTEKQVWTCAMHPQIRQNEPGNCPICGMELTLASKMEMSDAQVTMSENAQKLANVSTSKVSVLTDPKIETSITGRIRAAEDDHFAEITQFEARIDQLLATDQGQKVQQGQVIAYAYVPALIQASQELIQLQKLENTNPSLLATAKQKLKDLKLSDAQIETLVADPSLASHWPFRASQTGYINAVNVKAGQWAKKGTALYELTQLDHVWLSLDAYESQLSSIAIGDTITFTTPTNGELQHAVVSFISPTVDAATHTAEIRAELSNKIQQHKPNTTVSATIVHPIQSAVPVLVIPKSAILWSGEKAIVYSQVVKNDPTKFEAKTITTGRNFGDQIEVISGLMKGEIIVSNGTFTVDVAAQLAGVPSMMNPPKQKSSGDWTIYPPMQQPSSEIIDRLTTLYLELKTALTKDDFEGAQASTQQIHQFATEQEIKPGLIGVDIAQMTATAFENIGAIRAMFHQLSTALIPMLHSYEPASQLYVQHCPMADDYNGASWLSTEPEIINPYFGAQMLHCGSITDTIQHKTNAPK